MRKDILVGLDVGSTTVKAVVMARETKEILWKDYQKHETKQAEKTLEFFERIESELGLAREKVAVLATGSGANSIAPVVGARFIQEVNAVSLAVRTLHPDVRSVIELGGQDAKIIIYRQDPKTGALTTIPSMNDKCASGTGATIEKIAAKVGVKQQVLGGMGYLSFKDNLVHIAAKCGVFAETDVVGHLKAGLPEDQIMASLFDSIVSQNLAVLTRGNTLMPKVLLLGGPNTYIKGMVEAWRHNIPFIWKERKVSVPEGVPLEELITVPENAQYFAAIGAVEFALEEGQALIDSLTYKGLPALKKYIEVDRDLEKSSGGAGLWKDKQELDDFLRKYTKKPFEPALFFPGDEVKAFLGIDGGSTSTKAVLLDDEGKVLAKTYVLSEGNPIQDTMDCAAKLREYVEGFGATLCVQGVGTTGYAKDVLADVLGADAPVVETVAHTMAGQHHHGKVDVIVDVGGQDIKIIFLRDGKVADFRLNTQCSAGNGYFLQSTAQSFNIDIREFATSAFEAEKMPTFGYGCAVFMQSDIVNFQKEGWSPREIMAGLADVLPKNIWLYVAKVPNLASCGTRFILQGGTQYNLAAVKAQVDFITERFRGKGVEPEIIVHEHCGEAGAIGCALEALRMFRTGHKTTFIGLDAVRAIRYKKTNSENTRCNFCKNNCSRTFIDVKSKTDEVLAKYESKVPLEAGHRRVITGFSCDKGTVESVEQMKVIKEKMDDKMSKTPNTVAEMAQAVFRPVEVEPAVPVLKGFRRWRHRETLREIESNREKRKDIRIGMPKVLNMYSHTPFFMGYFQALGLPKGNLLFSKTTNEEMYKQGAKRGSIDPCFPSKLCISHVHDLLVRVHKRSPLNYILFPMVDSFESPLKNTMGRRACPTVVATPEAVKAAFTKEKDLFAEAGVKYLSPFLNMDKPVVLRRQMLDSFREALHLHPVENDLAIQAGLEALRRYNERFFERGREIIRMLEREKRLGFVLLARPYHNDEGVNHEILLNLQRLGYPVLAQDSVPVDEEFTRQVFHDDLEAGIISDPMEITDVWPTSYSENTSRKIWASKVVARHPNLVGIELSSFKCGHDAPPYTVIERIVGTSKTPFFTFRDLDENSPGGAIKIRMETIDYFLKREKEKLLRKTPADAVARLEDLFQLDVRINAKGKAAAPACSPRGEEETPAQKAPVRQRERALMKV